MDAKKDVPYLVYESITTKLERTIERIWILAIILIILLVGSNIAWLYYDKQFSDVIETTTIEAEQDGSGSNVIVGGDNYGTESKDN